MNSNALGAVLSRWWVIALLTAVGALLGALPSPAKVDQGSAATQYTATHTMLLNNPDAAFSSTTAVSPNQVTLLATVGEVPERVREAIGYAGNAAELAASVQVAFDQSSSALTFTTTQTTPELAVAVADGFADETNAYITTLQDQVYEDRVGASRERLDELKADLEAKSTQLAAAPENAVLQAEVDAVRNEYTVALEQNRSLTEDRAALSFTTIDRAEAVAIAQNGGLGAPRSRTTRGLLGALVGGALGIGVAVVLARIDRKLRTREQIEAITGLRARVVVPYVKDDKKALAVLTPGSHDSLSDAYRTLRNVVGFMHTNLPPVDRARVTLVVSPGPGEGKTSLVSNLAATFAETGQHTVAVNTDFRRPQLANRLSDTPWESTPYLLDDLAWIEPAQLLKPTRHAHLELLDLSGLGTPDELARVSAALIPRLADEADAVVVDTSPVTATAEVLELVPLADLIVLVVRANRTDSEGAQRSLAILRDLTTAPIVLVIVGLKQDRAPYYYDYRERRGPKQASTATAPNRRGSDGRSAAAVPPATTPRPAAAPSRTAPPPAPPSFPFQGPGAHLDLDEIDEFLRQQPPPRDR